MNINDLKELAKEFGLPVIERDDNLTIIGEEEFIIFNLKENNQCQMIT